MTISPKPIVLLLGEVFHAKNEWKDLAEIAELRVSFLQLVLHNRILSHGALTSWNEQSLT